jgi:radical SAM protein with 4Fe4S-binding SPASM domain
MNRNKDGITNHGPLAYAACGENAVVWNRFCPSLLQLPADELEELLLDLDDGDLEVFEADFAADLERARLSPRVDYARKFSDEMDAYLATTAEQIRSWTEGRPPFRTINVFNEECNLDCSYCIMKHSWGLRPPAAASSRHRRTARPNPRTRMLEVLHRQYERMERHGVKEFIMSFNGGEALLRSDLVRQVVGYIREQRGDRETLISLNTNGTTVSDGIARFLARHDVETHVSIDGCGCHHDRTRVFRDGRGSYEKVLRGVERLRSCRAGGFLEAFQGTIDDFSALDREALFALAGRGFKQAQLSPNLIGVEVGEGERRAAELFELARSSQDRELTVNSSIFDSFKLAVDLGADFEYAPYCNGLAGRTVPFLQYNASADRFSYLCQYAVPASVPAGHSADPYDPAIAEAAIRFLETRVEATRRHCMDCSIVGACRGGCILDGLSHDNRLNEAACSYRRALWLHYVRDISRQQDQRAA